jgi:succinate dehydrogenase / fumarate reductase iron-sulfur subunit
MALLTFRLWRGQNGQGQFQDYRTEAGEGMVVLDAVHAIQATDAPDLACRWNCKAGKCGSCSAEINGSPRLMCMTRLDELPADKPITVEPMRAFPHLKDLVTDVSWNFEVKKKIRAFTPRPPDAPDGTWRMQQSDIDRVQEFRKCIECFLCQDVCACSAITTNTTSSSARVPRPRWRSDAPLDTADRVTAQKRFGIGYCVSKYCTVSRHITITDNAIIPLKERVVVGF